MGEYLNHQKKQNKMPTLKFYTKLFEETADGCYKCEWQAQFVPNRKLGAEMRGKEVGYYKPHGKAYLYFRTMEQAKNFVENISASKLSGDVQPEACLEETF